MLIWFAINLNFLIRKLYFDELVEIKIPINLQKNYQLTDREMEMLRMLVKRQTNREMAYQFSLTISTIKYHLTNIYQKFDVKNRSELMNLLEGRRREGKVVLNQV
ncbi:MAG: helix-turn-helix domain-containing protein [Brevinematia bacterium]